MVDDPVTNDAGRRCQRETFLATNRREVLSEVVAVLRGHLNLRLHAVADHRYFRIAAAHEELRDAPGTLAKAKWETTGLAPIYLVVSAASVGPESPRGRRLGPEGVKTVVGSTLGSMRIPRKQFCISSQF